MQNKAFVAIVAVVVAVGVGAGAFVLGMKMSGGQQAGVVPGPAGGQRGWAPGQPGQGSGRGMGGPAGPPQGGFRSGPDGGAFVGGKVISKDKDSVTVSLPQGGSKTVYLSKSTRFQMLSAGSAADISVGETITAVGNTGPDGSVTARAITMSKP